MGETTTGLLEDLRRRRFIVRAPVVVVAVLVAKEIVIRVALPPPPDLTQGFVVAELRIGEHEPRSVGAEPLLALDAGVLGDHDLHRDADDASDHRVGDAGIARGAVEHRLAGLEPVIIQPRQQHAQDRLVFEGAPGLRYSSWRALPPPAARRA